MGVVAPCRPSAPPCCLPPSRSLTGERPSTIVWVGPTAALPGIWLVSREPPAGTEGAGGSAAGFVDGIVAGAGFGCCSPPSARCRRARLLALMDTQVASLLPWSCCGVLMGGDPRPSRGEEWWGLAAGLLATLAVVAFLLARHEGLLSVAAVLTSLYPAFTVLLATLLLGERLHRSQSVGLALCVVSVACVAAG